MHRQARIAFAAGGDPAARRAQQRRCVAAAIEEHQHLPVAGEVALDREHCRRGDPGLHRVRAQVNEADQWRLRLRGAPLQAQAGVASRHHVLQRLERWGGAAEHHRNAGMSCAHDGQVARRVAQRSLVLLEGGIVFLVHHDQPELRHRREHRRARAEHQACLATEGAAPGEEALVVGEPRMQHRHRGIEALAEARQQLRRECDLGHQHQRPPPRGQYPFDEPQVDLGLAAAGDAVQHEGAKGPEGAPDRLHRQRLLLGQLRSPRAHLRSSGRRVRQGSPRSPASRARAVRGPARATRAAARRAGWHGCRRCRRGGPGASAAAAPCAAPRPHALQRPRPSGSSVPRGPRSALPGAEPSAVRPRPLRPRGGGSTPPPRPAARALRDRAPARRRAPPGPA